MDFNFTEEQGMLRDSIARLIREQYDFETRRKVATSEAGWRPEMWETFAELGVFHAPFSEDDGGLGGGPIDAMIIMEEFGRGLVIEPYVPSVICAGGFLKHGGNAAQKTEYLEGLMAGEKIFAFAYAEPQSRFDLGNIATSAKSEGGGFVLNGRKSVVLGAPFATHLVVTARTSGGQTDRDGVSVFIVDKMASGVTTRDYTTVDGLRASEIAFENVAVSADAMIGDKDNGLPLVERVADEAIAALCAEAVGGMKVLLDDTVEYSKTRKQFNLAIGSFQVLQHRMADMFIAYEQSKSMTYMVALKLGEGDLTRQLSASAAKTQIGQAQRFIGQNAVQIHGGMGMTDELNIGHYFKRLEMINTQFGNADHHLRRYAQLSGQEGALAAE